MVSLYHDFPFAKQQTDFEKYTPGAHVKKMLQVAKLFVTNAKLSCTLLLKGDLRKFDGIFHDKRCEVRVALIADLFLDESSRAEFRTVQTTLENLEKKIQKMSTNVPQLESFGLTDSSILEKLELSCAVPEKMGLLFRAHLLTIGKMFDIRQDGSSIATVQPEILKGLFKTQLENAMIKRIIIAAQENGSSQSVAYLQEENPAEASLSERYIRHIDVIKPGQKESDCCRVAISCAFFALKTVLARAAEKRIPFLVREYRSVKDKNPEKALGVYFQSQDGTEDQIVALETEPSKDKPLFVIECFFNQDVTKEALVAEIEQKGFVNSCLANIALAPQYGYDDDFSLLEPDAQDEIGRFRALGREPSLFKIVHTCASTLQFEKVR